MAKKNATKQGNRTDFFDSRSGRVVADLNFADRGTSANLKSEIAFIREAFPLRSKDEVTLVLQSCDHNVDTAIACFTNGEAESILKEWNTQRKKSKNGSSTKKKRHKKRQAKGDEPCSDKADASQTSDQNESQLNQNGLKDSTGKSEDYPKNSTPMMTLDCPEPVLNLLHPPSPSSSEVSLPSSNSDQPTNAVQDPELAAKSLPDCTSHSSPAHAKYERMLSTGPDALKKTVKDLLRSSVSLPRFQLLLEEECEKSIKAITETFKELRQCLKDRESQLLSQMEEFRKQAVELLEQRQENAAALKLKSERVGGMTEPEVTQLRSEIKNFVTERKIDEELARTTRFVGDKEQLLTMIKHFGRVAPIKSCYSPVTLNPPPLPTKKAEVKSQNKKAPEAVNTVKPSVPTNTAVPSVTVSREENSVNTVSSHKVLQEVAELHAKLQAALEQQGLSSTGNPQGQKQSKPDSKKDRPNSASHAPSDRQTQPQRPQTALMQSQQNSQHKRRSQIQSAEPRGSQQGESINQSNRNSRRGNQGHSRNARAEASNEKKEVRKAESVQSSQRSIQTEQQLTPDKGKKSQSDADKALPSQLESNNKEFVQSGNKGHLARDQRNSGDERPRNRNRRVAKRGATESLNDRGPSKGPDKKIENGVQEKGPSQDSPVEKGPLGNEKKETLEEVNPDAKTSTVIENKDSTSVSKDAEKNNARSQSQDVTFMNGVEATTGGNPIELSEEKVHNGESVIKEALPQRQDRGTRRRGAQRDRRGGPSSRPTLNKDLNETKRVENGVGHTEKGEENGVQSGVEKAVQGSRHTKSSMAKKKSKIESSARQENKDDLDNAHVPAVNGHAHAEELNEDRIGR